MKLNLNLTKAELEALKFAIKSDLEIVNLNVEESEQWLIDSLHLQSLLEKIEDAEEDWRLFRK